MKHVVIFVSKQMYLQIVSCYSFTTRLL